MAFDPKPSTWLGAGYSLPCRRLCLPWSGKDGDKALPEVTDADAHATTGDIRKVLFGLMEAIFQAWNGVAVADRPTMMTIQKGSYANVETGQIETTFTARFTAVAAGYEIADEPS